MQFNLKRKIKYICLGILMFILFGRGLVCKAAQYDYENSSKDGVSCKYIAADDNGGWFGIDSIELSVRDDGDDRWIQVKINDIFINTEDSQNSISLNGYEFQIVNSFKEKYLTDYKNSCSNYIYIHSADGYNYFELNNPEYIYDTGVWFQYNYSPTIITTPGGDEITCHHTNATVCKNTTHKDQNGNPVYLEFEYYTSNDGSKKKYFTVAGTNNYGDMVTDDDVKKDTGLQVSYNDNVYHIYADAIKEIYQENNDSIEISDINITVDINNYFDNKRHYSIARSNSNSQKNEITTTPNADCESLLGSTTCASGKNCDPAYYLQVVFNIMKYVAVILLIVLSTMDFFGAVGSSDDGAMKKVANKCLKRLIICVIIFFIPTLLNYMLTLLKVYSSSTCGIK